MIPTRIKVAEDSAQACRIGELGNTTSGTLSVESATPEWNFCGMGMEVTMGYAIEAKMNGRGIRMAVKASGKANKGLYPGQHIPMS